MSNNVNDIFDPISTINLDSNLGGSLNELVTTINNNFQKLASLPYLKGDKGTSIGTDVIHLAEGRAGDRHISDFGFEVIQTVFDKDFSQSYITPVDIRHDTIAGIISSTTNDSTQLDLGDDDKAIQILKDALGSGDSLGASNSNIKDPDISVFVDKISGEKYLISPWLYQDMRRNEIELDNFKQKETFVDYTCYLTGHTENGKWHLEKHQVLPTLYFDEQQDQFCWFVNGQRTGVPAQGFKGEDGASVKCWVGVGTYLYKNEQGVEKPYRVRLDEIYNPKIDVGTEVGSQSLYNRTTNSSNITSPDVIRSLFSLGSEQLYGEGLTEGDLVVIYVDAKQSTAGTSVMVEPTDNDIMFGPIMYDSTRRYYYISVAGTNTTYTLNTLISQLVLKKMLDETGFQTNDDNKSKYGQVRGLYTYASNDTTKVRKPHMFWGRADNIAAIAPLKDSNQTSESGAEYPVIDYKSDTELDIRYHDTYVRRIKADDSFLSNHVADPNDSSDPYTSTATKTITISPFKNEYGVDVDGHAEDYSKTLTDNSIISIRQLIKANGQSDGIDVIEESSRGSNQVPNAYLAFIPSPKISYENPLTSQVVNSTNVNTSALLGDLMTVNGTESDTNVVIGGSYKFGMPWLGYYDNTDKKTVYNGVQFKRVDGSNSPLEVKLDAAELNHNGDEYDNTTAGWRTFLDVDLLSSPVSTYISPSGSNEACCYVGTNECNIVANLDDKKYCAKLKISAIQYQVRYSSVSTNSHTSSYRLDKYLGSYDGNFTEDVLINTTENNEIKVRSAKVVNEGDSEYNLLYSSNWLDSGSAADKIVTVTEVVYYIFPSGASGSNIVDLYNKMHGSTVTSYNSLKSDYICMRFRVFHRSYPSSQEYKDTIYIQPISNLETNGRNTNHLVCNYPFSTTSTESQLFVDAATNGWIGINKSYIFNTGKTGSSNLISVIFDGNKFLINRANYIGKRLKQILNWKVVKYKPSESADGISYIDIDDISLLLMIYENHGDLTNNDAYKLTNNTVTPWYHINMFGFPEPSTGETYNFRFHANSGELVTTKSEALSATSATALANNANKVNSLIAEYNKLIHELFEKQNISVTESDNSLNQSVQAANQAMRSYDGYRWVSGNPSTALGTLSTLTLPATQRTSAVTPVDDFGVYQTLRSSTITSQSATIQRNFESGESSVSFNEFSAPAFSSTPYTTTETFDNQTNEYSYAVNSDSLNRSLNNLASVIPNTVMVSRSTPLNQRVTGPGAGRILPVATYDSSRHDPYTSKINEGTSTDGNYWIFQFKDKLTVYNNDYTRAVMHFISKSDDGITYNLDISNKPSKSSQDILKVGSSFEFDIIPYGDNLYINDVPVTLQTSNSVVIAEYSDTSSDNSTNFDTSYFSHVLSSIGTPVI